MPRKKSARTAATPPAGPRGRASARSGGAAATAVSQEMERRLHSVLHDLRAPLRAVDGFADLLQQQFAAQLPEEARSLILEVRAGAARMAHLLEGLISPTQIGRKPGTTPTAREVRAKPPARPAPLPQLKLRVLLLEDNLQDRRLIQTQLRREHLDVELILARGRSDFEAALGQGVFQVVISDFDLPQYDGLTALRLVRSRFPDLPFILISGQLGEEQAVECVKRGATDYVLKQSLARLGPVIRRALLEAEARLAQRRADETVRELSRRLLRFQDEGRRQIARELHDSVGQNLSALGLNLGSAERLVPATNAPLKLLLADCLTLSNDTVQALRTVSYLLHPPALDALGLPGALADYLAGFSRRSGIAVSLKIPGNFGRLPVEMETALYRIVQESLTNIHRHSGSVSARLTLRRSRGTIVLEIEDDGRGLPPATLHQSITPGRLGVGIAGMRERLQLLGGRLELESSPAGTRVRAVLLQPPPA